MKTITVLALALVTAAPLAAQTRRPLAAADTTPAISLRPFFLASGEQTAAKTTFKAVFGESVEPFLGGGVQVAFRNGFFVDLGASRFKKTGQRAFLDTNSGKVYRLSIPLTTTVTPFEVSAGYRLQLVQSPRVVPYVGAGIGSYGYKESSDFAAADENVDTRHVGYLLNGGVEFRVYRWVGVAVDAAYTHIPGILGANGLSKDAGEKDLGGIAARFKFIVGR